MGSKVVLEFDYMMKDIVCTHVKVLKGGIIQIKNYTDIPLERAFGKKVNRLSLHDIEELFEYRCFEKERVDCVSLLQSLGIKEYDCYAIVRKTHGIMSDDFFWIRFSGEDIKYDDIRVR